MIIKTNQTLWISVVLMLYYFLCVPCSIAEDLPIYTHKDFVYQLKEDGTAIITKYTGIDTSLVIPDRLNNIIVSQIGNYALKDSISIKEIMIPDDVNIEENVFANCLNLEKITISKTHKYLVQDRGVIYNKSGTMLICCPCSLKLEEYNVINGTVEICDKAFNFNDSIKQIVLPEGLKRIGDSAFIFAAV